jgi:hypothetical protein
MRAGVDPSRRLTARAVLEHPWLAQVDAPTKPASRTTRGVLGWLSDAVSVECAVGACTACSTPRPLVLLDNLLAVAWRLAADGMQTVYRVRAPRCSTSNW